MNTIETVRALQPDTRDLAYSGRDVDYINGYEAGFEAAKDALLAQLQQEAAAVPHGRLSNDQVRALMQIAHKWAGPDEDDSRSDALEMALRAVTIQSAGPHPGSAPGATDAERAAWLADKIIACGDYAKEAAAMLRRWPAGEAQPVATLWLGSTDKTPAEKFLPLPAMYDLPKGAHQLYAAPVKVEADPVWCDCGDGIVPDSGAKCGNCVAADSAGRIKVEAQPQLYNFSSFDDWWLPHGKYNALFSASLGATPSEQIKKSHELMKLTWQVARELAASPSPDAPGGEDKP
jgi:hypothetical protein